MQASEVKIIDDFKQYYALLRQGEYLLSAANCEVIGIPVLEDEEPVAHFEEKEQALYDRSGKFTMIFNTSNKDVDVDELFTEKDLAEIKIDCSDLKTDMYFMYGGKLSPIYNKDVVSDYLGIRLIGSDESIQDKYIWSKTKLIGLGATLDNQKPVAVRYSAYSKSLEEMYDCRLPLANLGLKFVQNDEFEALQSFHCLTDSNFRDFPKSWGVDLASWELVGYVSQSEKLYKFENVAAVNDNRLSNILGKEEVDPEDIVLHIRELAGFKGILNLANKKITSLQLIGVLEDGRGVFKSSESLKQYDFKDILKMFYAKYRI